MSQLSLLAKEQGIASVWAHADEWRDEALRVIDRFAAAGVDFTADDIRPQLSEPPHVNSWGAAFNRAAKAGLIRKVGYKPSTHEAGHARVVAIWRGANAA